jgi:Sec-independent protein secretion pathway component TatC
LIITIVVSALVGLNTVISLYAFANRPNNKKSSTTTAAATSSSSILGALGASTSLFTACPTCASFYIFSIMAGSLAPTIAAFAVTYYALFVVVSIPLLLVTPFITALSIRRMMVSQCSLDNKKRSNPANNVG